MADNLTVNKVVYDGDTLIDLTEDTVTVSDVAQGKTFHLASGVQATGTAVSQTVNDGVLTIQRNGYTVGTFTANQSTNTTANIAVPDEPVDLDYTYQGSEQPLVTATTVQEALDELYDQNDELYNTKQAVLVSGTNIKTLSNYSLLGSGNIDLTASNIVTQLVVGSAQCVNVDEALNELNDNKQDALVSGTNIKTINNESLLGSGNITVSGGSSYTAGSGINIANNEISVDSNMYYNKTLINGLLSTKQNELTAGHNITISNNVISSSGATVYYGTTEPSASIGSDGDLYVMYSEE